MLAYKTAGLEERICKYCDGGSQDNETHFLLKCRTFEVKRACFMKRLENLTPNLGLLSEENQVKTILCPTSPQAAKLANKFIGIMFRARENIDKGIDLISYPTWEPMQQNPFLSHVFDSSSCSSYTLSDMSVSFMSSPDFLEISV